MVNLKWLYVSRLLYNCFIALVIGNLSFLEESIITSPYLFSQDRIFNWSFWNVSSEIFLKVKAFSEASLVLNGIKYLYNCQWKLSVPGYFPYIIPDRTLLSP